MAHRYWRLYIWKPGVSTVPSIAEMELRSSLGGSDETGSGTASANNESWGAAANAFDGVTTNFWAPSGSPAWIAYDFGSGNDLDIVEISITARNDADYNQTPFKFDLEYSDNGSDWTVLYTFRSATYTQGQTRVFNSADATNLVDIVPGSYRYYRIHVDSTFTDVGGCTVAELDLRESSGGSDVTGSGTSDASSDYSVDYDSPKAFDDDTNTFWSSELISVPHWLSYDFGAGNEKAIVEIALRIRGDSYYSAQDITEFRVQVSSDNSTWYTINVEQAIPVWSIGLQRVYTIDLGISVVDTVEVAEDVSVSVVGVSVEDLDISTYDAISIAEDVSFSFLSIVSIIDTLLVGEEVSLGFDSFISVTDSVEISEDVTGSVTSDTLSLGLAHGNSAPYDYFSLDDSEADPITVQIELDQTGGDLDSDYVLIYLIADDSFDLVTIKIQSEDAGVEWKISETDSDYGDSIKKSSVTAGAYPVYAKAIVANDGTITTDQISANFKVTAW